MSKVPVHFQVEVAQWARETFPHATPKTIISHLLREAEELVHAATEPASLRAAQLGIAEESADILLLLFHLCDRCSIDLLNATAMKFERNKRRQWGAPDAEGVAEHIRSAQGEV